jgi:hypothetical protein
MLFMSKRYTEAQGTLSLARELFLSVGDATNAAFVSGFLGLAQLEAVKQGSESEMELLMSAEENIVAAANAFKNARVRGEAARMWKMAAVVNLERIQHVSFDAAISLRVKAESYLDLAWQALYELNSINRMDQEATTNQHGPDSAQLQIINIALEIAIKLSHSIKDSEIILEKWRLRAKGEENKFAMQ